MSVRLGLFTLAVASCDNGAVDLERMIDQHKYLPYQSSGFFEDGRIMRRPPEGTVHRSQVLGPPELVDGMSSGAWVTQIPVPLDRALLVRGQSRFRIFCAACHGVLGDAQTPVAKFMTLRPPPSLHEARLRDYPPGRVYRVIQAGYGLMPSYAQELSVSDRWAVVAYLQALQLSQSIASSELSQGLLNEAKPWLE